MPQSSQALATVKIGFNVSELSESRLKAWPFALIEMRMRLTKEPSISLGLPAPTHSLSDMSWFRPRIADGLGHR
jgi:hypothetical protein